MVTTRISQPARTPGTDRRGRSRCCRGHRRLLVRTWWAEPDFTDEPFTLGVASGDPLPDGVVLWTRLAPDPLAADGTGGMPPHVVPVVWQVAAVKTEAGARHPYRHVPALSRQLMLEVR
ncbi:PhoD-like phosphatase N-terminal domain-containing protein [Micromonospora sp. L32]